MHGPGRSQRLQHLQRGGGRLRRRPLGVNGTERTTQMTYEKVTVTVTDVDEDGSISLSAQQPQDRRWPDRHPDRSRCDRSGKRAQDRRHSGSGSSLQAMDGPWIVISGAGATDTARLLSPSKRVLVTRRLRTSSTSTSGRRVTYTDKHGDDKTAMAVSAHAVRAVPVRHDQLSDPAFPED